MCRSRDRAPPRSAFADRRKVAPMQASSQHHLGPRADTFPDKETNQAGTRYAANACTSARCLSCNGANSAISASRSTSRAEMILQ
jgi:hypothetical protein